MKALVAALALILSGSLSAQTIAIDSGQMDGKTLPSGVRAWLGVPFAAPPVRELRWKTPQPAAKWDDVYHADRFAPMCLQPLRNRRMNHYFGSEATSEDCLYLNIWAPKSGETSCRSSSGFTEAGSTSVRLAWLIMRATI
jgi:para-nitrobenzyl esterase